METQCDMFYLPKPKELDPALANAFDPEKPPGKPPPKLELPAEACALDPEKPPLKNKKKSTLLFR